jgi:hypothetical protein
MRYVDCLYEADAGLRSPSNGAELVLLCLVISGEGKVGKKEGWKVGSVVMSWLFTFKLLTLSKVILTHIRDA